MGIFFGKMDDFGGVFVPNQIGSFQRPKGHFAENDQLIALGRVVEGIVYEGSFLDLAETFSKFPGRVFITEFFEDGGGIGLLFGVEVDEHVVEVVGRKDGTHIGDV
jgi:hypothetical protein